MCPDFGESSAAVTVDCLGLWLDPRPADSDLLKCYEKYYTHRDATDSTSRGRYNRAVLSYLKVKFRLSPSLSDRAASVWFWLHPGRRAAAAASAMGIRPVNGGRLLEIGCGDGKWLRLLQGLGWHCTGIDFDADAVRRARQHGLDVQVATADDLPFCKGEFDAVVSNHVIEHLPYLKKLFDEAKRVLKPGGKLVALTPNAASAGHKLFGKHWRGLEVPRHLQVFTVSALKSLAQRHGFDIVCCGSSGRGGAILVKSWKQWRGRSGQNAETLSLVDRTVAELLGLIEGVLKLIGSESGEEIILIASNPNRCSTTLTTTREECQGEVND